MMRPQGSWSGYGLSMSVALLGCEVDRQIGGIQRGKALGEMGRRRELTPWAAVPWNVHVVPLS